MIPILFEKTETVFTSNGIGRLSDAISCIVSEERNGKYELKMVYPVNGTHYGDLAHSRIIYAQPAEGMNNQAFRIYKITKPNNGKITVLAQHISYQLGCIPVSPFSASTASGALSGLVTNAAVTCPFTMWTDISKTADFIMATPESMRSAIGGMAGNILELYGGELEWDMYTVKLHAARGENRGKKISYGKNITQITQEENIDKVITGIYPFYNGDDYVELTEKIVTVQTTESYPYQRIEKLDMTRYFTGTPTESQLRTKAHEYIDRNVLGVPRLTIKAAFVDEETHTPVYLCDTVTVYYAPLRVAVQAKVTKLDYNTLLERYETITVGAVQDSILNAVIDAQKESRDTQAEVRAVEKATSQSITVLQADIRTIYGSLMADHIYPYGINLDEVRDTDQQGTANNVLIFRIKSDMDGNTVDFHGLLDFNVHTFTRNVEINNETVTCYQDGVVRVRYLYGDKADGSDWAPLAVFYHAYGDGQKILTLNFNIASIEEGEHFFIVELQATGASLYSMAVITAYLFGGKKMEPIKNIDLREPSIEYAWTSNGTEYAFAEWAQASLSQDYAYYDVTSGNIQEATISDFLAINSEGSVRNGRIALWIRFLYLDGVKYDSDNQSHDIITLEMVQEALLAIDSGEEAAYIDVCIASKCDNTNTGLYAYFQTVAPSDYFNSWMHYMSLGSSSYLGTPMVVESKIETKFSTSLPVFLSQADALAFLNNPTAETLSACINGKL